MDSDTLSIVIGAGLLLVGLVMVLSLGTLLSIKSALSRKKAAPAESEGTGDGGESSSSLAQKVKAWIGVLAAVVGLITTLAGTMKSCESGPSAPSSPPTQEFGARCATPYGTCQMMQVAEVGQGCTCFDQMGNFASGNVVR